MRAPLLFTLLGLAACQSRSMDPIVIDPNDPYAAIPSVMEASQKAAREITEENVDQAFEAIFEEINRGLGG